MNILIMIILISLLVLVHEAGHFVAARLCGVRVTRFGIGMPIGPSWKLFSWQNTNFYLHAFLFGGYVAFPDDETNTPDEEKEENEILPPDSPELYENKTIIQKLFIVSAGVIMNLVFAVFLVILCASIFHKLPTSNQNIYIAGIQQNVNSNIKEKNLKENDKILKINNNEINSLYQINFFAKKCKLFDSYAENDLIETNLKELKKLNPNLQEEIKENTIIKLPKTKAEKEINVTKDMLKGLEKYKPEGKKLSETQINLRNEIYKKDEYTTNANISLSDLATALSDTYKPVNFTVLRNGKVIEIENIILGKDGLFGIQLKVEDIYTTTDTPKKIIKSSIIYCFNTTKTMLYSLWQLFSGKVSASDMHGIIAVVKVGGDIIAAKGILNGLLLTAMISINLAIMNFLPIPALDGGHVMFLTIEKITGKKPSKELSDKITNVFFFLLIVLMIVICYNDIFALISKKL